MSFLLGVRIFKEDSYEGALLNNPSGINLIVELQATGSLDAIKGSLYSADGSLLLSTFPEFSLSYSIFICFLWPNSKFAVTASSKEPCRNQNLLVANLLKVSAFIPASKTVEVDTSRQAARGSVGLHPPLDR